MGIKEGALALADELEAFEDGDCEECIAYGQPECKGHLSCAEIIARYSARKVREAVERDGEGATTVSAYDLLPEDERKAIAWVREHGGLDEVEKRIMPEGMEWPKVDGNPVDFVTGYEPSLGALEAVSIYSNGACEVMSHDGIVKNVTEIHVFKPKALDADGVEIRVGDTVWDTETGCGRTVRAVNDNGTVEFDGYENRGWFGKFLTHTKPDLDTWERIEEDIGKEFEEYWSCKGRSCSECPSVIGGKRPTDWYGTSCYKAQAMDIMHRCKALVERGEL